jgi:hypothetical protein
MKAVTVKELSRELQNLTPKELRDLCLILSRFKKENKELLTYLLFESSDEDLYVKNVKIEIDRMIEEVNKKSYYFIKKGLRRILQITKKHIRYSRNKKTEIELLIYYCTKLQNFTPSIKKNKALSSLYDRQIDTIIEKLNALHEDLRYDYEPELDALTEGGKPGMKI